MREKKRKLLSVRDHCILKLLTWVRYRHNAVSISVAFLMMFRLNPISNIFLVGDSSVKREDLFQKLMFSVTVSNILLFEIGVVIPEFESAFFSTDFRDWIVRVTSLLQCLFVWNSPIRWLLFAPFSAKFLLLKFRYLQCICPLLCVLPSTHLQYPTEREWVRVNERESLWRMSDREC